MLKVIKAKILSPKVSKGNITSILSSNPSYFFGFVAWNFKLHLFHIVPLVRKHP